MHIDVLWVRGGRVALVLSAVFAGRVRDNQARRRLLSLLADHHCPPALSVVRDDLPVVVPEHVGGVEIERPGLDDAGEVDGGALLDVELGGAEDGRHRLDDCKVDPVLQVRGCRYLIYLFSYLSLKQQESHAYIFSASWQILPLPINPVKLGPIFCGFLDTIISQVFFRVTY